jgi:hypothetical protein
MAINIPIWPGSCSFFPGDTPFNFYDHDQQFQCDSERVADWCAKRLGYPLMQVELQDINFFAAFEEAITEYGNQVNTYAARDNIMSVAGFDTGSINLSQRYVEPSSLRTIFRQAKQYGTEAGAGGKLTYYTGSIDVKMGKQVYDLTDTNHVTLEKGSFSSDIFTIRKIMHQQPASSVRYLDPYADTGLGTKELMEQFGWGGMGTPISFLVMPLYYDILRMQHIEFNDQIRRSTFSFQLTNNRIRVFPIPRTNFTLYFEYTLDDENSAFSDPNYGLGKISDHSNIPYYNISYKHINSIGKQWIKKYTLAICKEILGRIRSKYSNVPIPDGEVNLDGDTLVSEGKEEKTALIEELRETLDQFSQQSQMERRAAVADNLSKQLSYAPLKIYVK